MKDLRISINKQKIILGFFSLLIVLSLINYPIIPSGQNIVNDILIDFGIATTLSTATSYLIIGLLGLLLLVYFFEK